ncbi:MAG: hypothetical protein MJB14_08590 [Spirochaetes bacterium]|nr:hypothetical protein [Spirochaetota bacterium]
MPLKNMSLNMEKANFHVSNTELKITGTIDDKNPGLYMEPFIEELHQNILQNSVTEIEIDITELSFLNSAGIKELINWIIKLDTLPEEQKYKIIFICNKNHLWQESSISTMSFLNQQYVEKKII